MPAWQQVYRGIEHGRVKDNCKKQAIMKKFPKEVEDFANVFVTLQEKRHRADYDPLGKYFKSEALQDIADAKTVIERFKNVPAKDKRAFAAYVLLKRRS